MSGSRAAVEKKLFEEFAAALAGAFETMSGERPVIEVEFRGVPPVERGLLWKQALAPLDGPVWACIEEAGWKAAGAAALHTAGVQDAPADDLKSACREILGRALETLSSSLTETLGREVVCGAGEESSGEFGEVAWAALTVALNDAQVVVGVGVDAGLVETILSAQRESSGADPVMEPRGAGIVRQASKTFDLLLDVELPVSVSFGRAQVPLKDVLKLTTGSIVELDRSVVEPVDIVINQRVIARGEVVIVEGNFGVRIQHVVSRNERLRSLE